jgi:ribonuclease HI
MTRLDVIEVLEVAAGTHCSSYQAELVALVHALKWLQATSLQWASACLVTDSQASLRGMSTTPSVTRNFLVHEAWQSLEALGEEGRQVVFKWIPSHCGVPGNERADVAASQARDLP